MTDIQKFTDLKKISKIIHCADIHIRNLRRHDEYGKQFNKFYDEVKRVKDDNTLIYIGGDIVHTKTDMSPELIDVVSEFLTTLSNIAPTIVITGNHDANLNNPDRLDALTPIINNLKNPNLFYLKDTGLYQFGDVIFSVFSIFDEPDKYIPASDIVGDQIKISLFHGPVTNSVTSVGFNIQGSTDISIFDGYDYALLGDIHMLQYLNHDETIAYASSLVQQNYGESYENHGFICWDLVKKTKRFYHLDNESGFHTLHLSDDKLVTYDVSKITTKSRVRLKVSNSSDTAIKDTIAKLKHEFKLDEIAIVKLDTISKNNSVDLSKANNYDVRNLDIQNKLIHDYLNLTLNLALEDELLQKVYDINRKTNAHLVDKNEVIRNIIWKPKTFEFSNMFSYGENNIINFENLKGIQGLFGPNASGKSSLLDAMCFCLFDTTSRAFKAEQVLNTKKDWFSCKFNFTIDGEDYFIEKKATKNSQGKVKVNIDFWMVDSNGDKKILNGEQRKDTNSIIRSYIGNYDDFTLMCLLIQNNSTNFVDKSQTERKEILAKFLDLNVFESLHDIANVEYKKILALIENTNIKELELQIEDFKSEVSSLTNVYIALEDSIIEVENVIKSINDKIVESSKEIKQVEKLNLTQLETKQKALSYKINSLEEEIKSETEIFNSTNDTLTTRQSQLDKLDLGAIKKSYDEFKAKEKYLLELLNIKEKLELKLEGKRDKLKRLEEHEYDPNCKYCVNNVFVKDAIQTKSEIDHDEKELGDITIEADALQTDCAITSDILELVENIKKLQDEITKLTANKNKSEISKLTLEKNLLESKNELQSVESKIEQYHNNESVIKKNSSIEEKISTLKDVLMSKNDELSKLNREKMDYHSKIKVNETKIDSLTEKIDTTRQLIREKAAYEYYLKSTDKDGISYQLMSKILPKIEDEINNILSNLVEFKILLNTDGKNVNAYIVYNNQYWPLELSSGMERFVSAIAIRVGLINISNLPKPTFFAIDEGLGVLDSTNLNQIYLLFNYIREVFQFTMIISHIDMVRDMVDNTLTIENDRGFSKLVLN